MHRVKLTINIIRSICGSLWLGALEFVAVLVSQLLCPRTNVRQKRSCDRCQVPAQNYALPSTPVTISFQGLNEIATSRNRSGTSVNLGGDFALSLAGSRSQYLPSNASARDVKLALEALDTVGTVTVERYDGDEEVRCTVRSVLGLFLWFC